MFDINSPSRHNGSTTVDDIDVTTDTLSDLEISDLEHNITFCLRKDGKEVFFKSFLKVQAKDTVDAIVKLTRYVEKNYPDLELNIISASCFDLPYCIEVGREYTTIEGNKVTMKKIYNEGTSYESMEDQYGHHRYTRQSTLGRCIGTSYTSKNNIRLSASYFNRLYY